MRHRTHKFPIEVHHPIWGVYTQVWLRENLGTGWNMVKRGEMVPGIKELRACAGGTASGSGLGWTSSAKAMMWWWFPLVQSMLIFTELRWTATQILAGALATQQPLGSKLSGAQKGIQLFKTIGTSCYKLGSLSTRKIYEIHWRVFKSPYDLLWFLM